MAQGAVKNKAKPAAAGKPKRGARITKPKKSKAGNTADKMQKKYAAGLVSRTEKLLGERAGHLELIGKGKKADKADAKKQGGGSRKFG